MALVSQGEVVGFRIHIDQEPGLFVGSGGALETGGPASLVICFIIIGVMLLLTMQALAELGVLYPVNGAFYQYAVRCT